MKKTNWYTKAVVSLSAIILIATSCQKEIVSKTTGEEIATSSARSEPVTRAYRDSFDSRLMFVPDIAGGWTAPNIAPAWYPGIGEGNASHMGKAHSYFNQHTNLDATFTTVSAPVTLFFSSQLANAGITNIPPGVSTIVYDDQGNSIWFHHTSINSTPVSPTKVNISGAEDIIGGTGKFSEATGHVTLNAFFNPEDIQQSSFWQNGWIRY